MWRTIPSPRVNQDFWPELTPHTCASTSLSYKPYTARLSKSPGCRFQCASQGAVYQRGLSQWHVINVDHWITPICQYQIQQDPMYMQVDMLSALGIFYAAGFLGQHCPDSRSSLLKPLIRHHIWGLRACFKHARRFFTFKEVFWKSVKHFISQSVVCRPLHVLTQLWASSLQGKVLLFSSQLLVTTRVDPAGRQAMPARYGQR